MYLRALRKAMINSLGPVGLYRLTGKLTKRVPRILMYHRFSDKPAGGKVAARTLEGQLKEIRKSYHIYPLSELVDCLAGENNLPANAIVLTVDDGYADFYQFAWPVLKSLEVPVTLYVTTRFIDGDIWLWPDKLHYLLSNTDKPHLQLVLEDKEVFFPIHDQVSCGKAWNRLNQHMLKLHPDPRDKLLTEIAAALEVETGPVPVPEYAAMEWGNIRELATSGIGIGAHTLSHPVLSTLTRQEAEAEIMGSKAVIEMRIGLKVNDFCYPNGQAEDFTDETRKVVAEAGFTNAVAAYHDRIATTDIYALRRYGVGEDMYQFRNVIHGFEYLNDLV